MPCFDEGRMPARRIVAVSRKRGNRIVRIAGAAAAVALVGAGAPRASGSFSGDGVHTSLSVPKRHCSAATSYVSRQRGRAGTYGLSPFHVPLPRFGGEVR